MREYSPLRSLGYTCFGGRHDPGRCYFVLYKAYYDASGSQADPAEQQSAIVVAALVATEKKWLRFEDDWNKLLEDFGVRSFHMTDFVAGRGEFSGWSGQQRHSFATQAIHTIKVRTNKPLACGTLLDAYAEVDRTYPLSEIYGAGHPRAGAYAVCAGLCHARVEEWLHRTKRGRPFAHVFEHGDEGQGALIEQLRVRERWSPVSILRKYDPETDTHVRQFEAVDFVAWHFRSGYREYSADSTGRPSPSLRALFRQLPITEGNEGCFDEAGLRGYCEKLHEAGLVPSRSAL